MAIRWILGLVSGLAFVTGLVFHVLIAALIGLIALLGVVLARPGSNPLAETYRDVRPVDREDW